MDDSILAAAERTWYAIDPQGYGHELILRVGLPRPREEGDWAVEVSIGVLEPRPMKIYGVDSWQAIQLGMRLISREVADFERRGWRFYWKEGGEAASVSELMA